MAFCQRIDDQNGKLWLTISDQGSKIPQICVKKFVGENTLELKMIAWVDNAPPSEEELREMLTDEQLKVYSWSNDPNDVYAGHTHGYHKVLYVVEGSINFDFPTRSRSYTLNAGDRLEVPAGIRHSAVVGPSGVTCLEAHMY